MSTPGAVGQCRDTAPEMHGSGEVRCVLGRGMQGRKCWGQLVPVHSTVSSKVGVEIEMGRE